MTEAELFMVDAEQVKQGGLEVSNVHRVANDIVGEVIRFSVDYAPFDTSSRHPQAETARVMVPSVGLLR